MKSRTYHRFAALAASALAIALVAASPASASGADATISAHPDAKRTQLFKGNGFKVKPGLMYGWDRDGLGKPMRALGARSYGDQPVRWRSWTRKRAVGFGPGWTDGCDSPCRPAYPWNGSRLKITAYRPRHGHFTRMRFAAAAGPKRYVMTLAYRGRPKKVTDVSWRILDVKRGAKASTR